MNKLLLVIFSAIVGVNSLAQSAVESAIVTEGKKLYATEMASWFGTDIFLAKFGDRREKAGGYLSYTVGDKALCFFFSRGENPTIISSFTFDSTYNVSTALIDGEERAVTDRERDLITIRQKALKAFQSDTLFRMYKDMNSNFIPLSDDNGKRVYILTGPQKSGVVVFGNDYLLTFDSDNDLIDKKRIHKNILPIPYGDKGGEMVLATMHTHLPETGDLITATDICTLMLYEKFAKWGQHYVLSEKNVSIWDCHKNELLVMTRKAWDRINHDQKTKKKKLNVK